VPLLDHPIRPALSEGDARALLAETSADPLVHAAVSLMLLAGVRSTEVVRLAVVQYEPGPAPRLDVLGGRRIRIAPSAARAVDTYLASQDAEADEPLLLGVQGSLAKLVRRAADRAGVQAGVHSLRRAAIHAALADGAPPSHIEPYFGISKALDAKALVALPEGYDAAMARTLEAAFGA
jgi:integrase